MTGYVYSRRLSRCSKLIKGYPNGRKRRNERGRYSDKKR